MPARKFRNFIAALFLGSSAAALVAPDADAARYNYADGIIDVERGDIPMDFQKHFEELGVHVPFRDILNENGIRNSRRMAAGTQLNIPDKYLPAIQAAVAAKSGAVAAVASAVVNPVTAPAKYDFVRGKIRFEDGDTLWDIEQYLKSEYGVYVPYSEIQRASKIRNPRRIADNTELTIPAKYLPALQAAATTKESVPTIVTESTMPEAAETEGATIAEKAPVKITIVKTRVVTDEPVLVTVPDRSPIDLHITDAQLAEEISAAIMREREVNEDWNRTRAELAAARAERENAESASRAASENLARIREASGDEIKEYLSIILPAGLKLEEINARVLTVDQIKRVTELRQTIIAVFNAAVADQKAATALNEATVKLDSAEDLFSLADKERNAFYQQTQDLILKDPNLVADINERQRLKEPQPVVAAVESADRVEQASSATLEPVRVPMVDVYTDTGSIAPVKKVKTTAITASAYVEIPATQGAAAAAEEMANQSKTPLDLTAHPKRNEGLIDLACRFNVSREGVEALNPELKRNPTLYLNKSYKLGGLPIEKCRQQVGLNNADTVQSTAMASLGKPFADSCQGPVPGAIVYSKVDPNDPTKRVFVNGFCGGPKRFIG